MLSWFILVKKSQASGLLAVENYFVKVLIKVPKLSVGMNGIRINPNDGPGFFSRKHLNLVMDHAN